MILSAVGRRRQGNRGMDLALGFAWRVEAIGEAQGGPLLPSAIVRRARSLSGAPVRATDLQASVSLVLAGLLAKGKAVVSRVYYLDREFEAVEEELAGCVAHIEWVVG